MYDRWAGATAADKLHFAILGAIIAIGAYLRLTGLGRQSLWFDEADIVVRAQRSWSDVFATFSTAGENGPVYNLFLATWVRIAGVSEVAVRFPSAVAGVLALPAIYLLARRLAGPQSGLFAAGLLAISPYHIWYSQEAKMYSLVVLLSILSTLCLVEALRQNHTTLWIVYVVITTIMFYTHVAAVLVFVAQALFIGLTYTRWAGEWKRILIAAAALTVPYIPIALWALRVVGGGVSTWHAEVGLIEAVRTVGVKFATFRSEPYVEFRAGWLYFIIALAGVVWLSATRQGRPVAILLASLTAVPVLGLWFVSLHNSVFSDRYIIVALPPYLILGAIALSALSSTKSGTIVSALVALILVAHTWVPISDVNRSISAEKEDWRSAYARIAEQSEPQDVLLLHPGYIISTLAYYGQRDARLGGHPVATVPAFDADWVTSEVMVNMLRDKIGGHTRIWLIESPDRVALEDRDDELERWLSTVGQSIWEDRVNGVRIVLYELPEDW